MEKDDWQKYLENWGVSVKDAEDDKWVKWQELLLLKYQDLINKEKAEHGGHAKVTETYRRGQLIGLIRDIKDIPTQYHVKVVDAIIDDMFHYGPIEPLMQRDDVSDVQIFVPLDDSDPQVIKYADRKGRHYYKGKGFRNYRHAATWLNRHLSQMGDRYDPAEVSKDATFPNGERMHIISGCSGYSVFDPKITDPKERYRFVPCMIITIRRFLRPFTINDLMNQTSRLDEPPEFANLKQVKRNYKRKTQHFKYTGGMVDPATMDYLQIMVKLAKNHLISGGTGCHEADTPILMFDGSIKRAADIEVGDQLMGPDSKPRTVLALHRGIDEMVLITPVKGEPFVVNAGHILCLKSRSRTSKRREICEISVRDFWKKSENFKHSRYLWRVGVEYQEKKLPIDPYILGVLLGDGGLTKGVYVSNSDEEIIQSVMQEAENRGLNIKKYENHYWFMANSRVPGQNSLINDLKDLGLYKKDGSNKFIPELYKTASRTQRLELLAGLLDTDGTLTRVGAYEYDTKSFQLAKDVQYLCRSLGLSTQIIKRERDYVRSDGEKTKKRIYVLYITLNNGNIPLRVKRKQTFPKKLSRDVLVTNFNLESVGVGEYFGFEVDGDHLYLDGQFIVHHNSAKTTLANALTAAIPDGTALIVAEESAEMQPQNQGHVIRLQEIKGVFNLAEAVKATLRMFPDRVFISEIRDVLAYVFLWVIQNGHGGSSTTLHAVSCEAAVDVLINFAANHPSSPERDMIRHIIYQHIHTVMHSRAVKDGPNQINRFLDEVVQLIPEGHMHPVMKFHQVGVQEDGEVAGYFEFNGPTDEFVQEMFAAGIPIPDSWGWETA